ncbi:MAG: hypothetical protein ACRC8Y_08540 [Chroococcales cyanobacterium]
MTKNRCFMVSCSRARAIACPDAQLNDPKSWFHVAARERSPVQMLNLMTQKSDGM